jgi:hypothetical protein
MSGDSFVFYRSFIQAIEDQPPDIFKKIIMSAAAYALDGTEPELNDSALKMAFSFMKPLIDSNNTKWEQTCNKRAENGRKGGLATQANARIAKANQANQANQADNDNENVNDNDDVNDPQKTSSSFFIHTIQEEAEKVGFTLDIKLAQRIAWSGIDPVWVTGPYNFLEFAEEMINKNVKYKDKPYEEKRLLFINAFSWEIYRAEFPAWQERQRHNAEIAEIKRQIERARDSPPEKCKCGGNLESRGGYLVCDSCYGFYSFEQEYIFNESYAASLKDLCRIRGG